MESFKLPSSDDKIKETFVRYLEARHHCKLTLEAKRAFSVCNEEPIFYGEQTGFRILSQEEVLEAKDNWFSGKIDLIPILDYYDNDFLVYNCHKKNWGLYNMNDHIMFKEFKEFNDFLEYFSKSILVPDSATSELSDL